MAEESEDYLTTRELADLLRIKERKVYDLVANNEVPCTRATGKILFPRADIQRWLAASSNGDLVVRTIKQRPNVFLGSHDPLLEWALRESSCGLASYFDGSFDGLRRFKAHEGLASALHIYDENNLSWNVEAVRDLQIDDEVVLMEFCQRQRGLISSSEPDHCVHSIKDLKGKTIAPRQLDAGSQPLLLSLLQASGLAEDDYHFSHPCRTETEAVAAVFEGIADATLGLSGLASQYRLNFTPLIDERFDLLFSRKAWFSPAVQQFIQFCHADIFKQRATQMPGYNVENFGVFHFNSE
ncbi:MAG: putative molybdopterin biosynthesis protein [Parasphingorhabdus sp.]|jgi:putative molybdopterin biosynthesis protein